MTFNIEFDYRYDVEGFYGPEAREMLEIAAQSWEEIIEDDFPAFLGGRTIEIYAPFFDQFKGVKGVETIDISLENDVDDLLIFVGTRATDSFALANGGPIWGPSVFWEEADRIDYFSKSLEKFQPFFAELSTVAAPVFSNGSPAVWYFGSDAPPFGTVSFLSVAIHEIGHALGIATPAGEKYIFDNLYDSPNVQAVTGGPIAVDTFGHPILDGTPYDSVIEPVATFYEAPFELDKAFLSDLGYTIKGSTPIGGTLVDGTFTATPGPNAFFGGASVDTAVMGITTTDATVSIASNGVVTITDRNGTGGADTLTNIEIAKFSEKDISLNDFSSLTQLSNTQFKALAEMYVAYFNRAPDAEGLFYWADKLAEGQTLDQIAEKFFDQDETRGIYTDPSNTDAFVTAVYANVLGRTPDADGLAFWTGKLDSNEVTKGAFVLKIIQGAKNGGGPEDIKYLTDKTDLGIYFSAIKGMSDGADGRQVMATFGDQATSDKSGAKAAIDGHYSDATASGGGEFLFNLVGIVDNPFPDGV